MNKTTFYVYFAINVFFYKLRISNTTEIDYDINIQLNRK